MSKLPVTWLEGTGMRKRGQGAAVIRKGVRLRPLRFLPPGKSTTPGTGLQHAGLPVAAGWSFMSDVCKPTLEHFTFHISQNLSSEYTDSHDVAGVRATFKVNVDTGVS